MRTMPDQAILAVHPLGFPWPTIDPFLFCVHHDDAYPAGDEAMAPQASLAGRSIGQDFSRKDGWSMYHGQTVPGFPAHPHRGFETVTIVRRGLVDHSDSLRATARFGSGDVQWLTAGAGIVHCEMFPLVQRGQANPLELFQIWLNLPARNKMVPPHFTMQWNEQIPRLQATGAEGKVTTATCVAGELQGLTALAPPPDSWASDPAADLAIYTLRLEPGARWTLPGARGADTRRMLYFFQGSTLGINDEPVQAGCAIEVQAQRSLLLTAGEQACELLVLQGRPIGEPVVQHGPFVMNTAAQIHQAFADYQRTGFGGWPWGASDPVHAREAGRFARHADGRVETRET